MDFRRVNDAVPITEIVEMYDPYHEADITRFVDEIDRRISERNRVTCLARLRAYSEMTQKMLADRSGVSIRMIEQYEQGRKDLKHASAETVIHLAHALDCSAEELIG